MGNSVVFAGRGDTRELKDNGENAIKIKFKKYQNKVCLY